MLPGLLACALSLTGERGWCDIRVTRVDIDGSAREIASGDSRAPAIARYKNSGQWPRA